MLREILDVIGKLGGGSGMGRPPFYPPRPVPPDLPGSEKPACLSQLDQE